jgi:NADH-quinone oxidoreductase subunit H
MTSALTLLAATTGNAGLMTMLGWPTIRFVLAMTCALLIVACMNLVERRGLAFFQARQGPNRVGYGGILQIVADPIKLFTKESITVANAEKIAYHIGPMIPIIPPLLVWSLIPFGPGPMFSATSGVNVGLLLILALTSTSVYGLILGGWASNNKFSLMGGLRSAAQMVSYEVPFGLSIVGVLMLTGSLDLQKIVRYQEQHVWMFIPQIVACFIFLVSMTAECNRVPFDLPEGESELVAGYHTEYSGLKFTMYYMAEYAAMLTNGALIVILFFGGWTLAMGNVGLTSEVLLRMGWWGGFLGVVIFTAKVMFFQIFFVWLRATYPRFRFDQLMELGWKWMIPLALVNILVTGLVVLVWQSVGA